MIDWTQFATGGATRPDSFSGMQPEFNSALAQLIASAPPEIQQSLRVSSGYRSPERQAELWADALKKYGSAAEARKWVAPPGNSQHNHGNAADLKYASPAAREWAHANAARFGLAFPLDNEDWHIELATARDGGAQHTHNDGPDMAGGGGADALAGQAASDTLASPPQDPIAEALASLRAQAPVETVEQTYDPLAALRAGPVAAVPQTAEQAANDAASARQASGPMPETMIAPDGSRYVYNAATGQYTNAEMLAANMRPSAGQAFEQGMVNGSTMGWFDEMAQKVGAPAFGVENYLATGRASAEQRPVANIAGQVTGGVMSAAPIVAGAGAIPTVAKAAGYLETLAPLWRGVANVGLGAAAGGVQGAIQGAGEAKPGERLAGAAGGATVGAALGGVVAPVASVAGKALGAFATSFMGSGLNTMFTRLKGRDAATIAKAFGISKEAATAVKNAIEADDFTAAAKAMGKTGPDAMLADAGPATGQLLDTAAQSGGPANRVVQEAVNTRAEGAYGRLTTTMDDLLGSPEGVQGLALKTAQRTAAERKAAYGAAYSKPIDYSTGGPGDAINRVINRIEPEVVSAAIKKANAAMRDDELVNMQVMASISPEGKVTFSNPPNVQQLDYIKKALQSIARDGTDPITGSMTDEARRAARQAADLGGAVKAAVPEYGVAVRLGGDAIAEKEALKLGRGILNPNQTREQVRETLGDEPSREALLAAAQGARSAIDDALANVKATLANPDTDIKEAQKLVSSLSSRAAREKLTLILGDQAPELFEQLDQAAAQLYLRGVVARGSQTAGRLATRETIKDSLNSSATESILRGEPVNASKRVIQFLTNRTPEANAARERAVYDEIANTLTAIKGPQAQAALVLIEKASNGQPLTEAQARMVAKIVTTGAALSLQSAGQATAKQSGLRQ